MVFDIHQDSNSFHLVDTAVFEDTLYFVADGDIWSIDQGGNLTELAGAYSGLSHGSNMTVLDGYLYFVGDDQRLWRVDGEGSASLAADVAMIPSTSLAALGDELYFKRRGETNYSELWKIDTEGNLSPADGITPLGQVNDELYFSMDDGVHGEELWKYDSEGNAVRLTDINPTGSSDPLNPVLFGDEIYFTADDGTRGGALWKLDSSGQASFVVDIMPGRLIDWTWHETVDFNGDVFFLGSSWIR